MPLCELKCQHTPSCMINRQHTGSVCQQYTLQAVTTCMMHDWNDSSGCKHTFTYGLRCSLLAGSLLPKGSAGCTVRPGPASRAWIWCTAPVPQAKPAWPYCRAGGHSLCSIESTTAFCLKPDNLKSAEGVGNTMWAEFGKRRQATS